MDTNYSKVISLTASTTPKVGALLPNNIWKNFSTKSAFKNMENKLEQRFGQNSAKDEIKHFQNAKNFLIDIRRNPFNDF